MDSQTLEIPFGPIWNNFTAVIGSGLEMINLKMPLCKAKVKVTNGLEKVTMLYLKEALSTYGIEEITQYSRRGRHNDDRIWGEVIFHDRLELDRAIRDFTAGSECEFSMFPVLRRCARQTFTIKLRLYRCLKLARYKRVDKDQIEKGVIAQIVSFVGNDNFKINLKDFSEKEPHCDVFATFYNRKDCTSLTDGLDRTGLQDWDYFVKVDYRFIACLLIPKSIYLQVKSDIDEYMKKVGTRFKPNPLSIHEKGTDHYLITILISSSYKLAKIKLDLDTLIKGDTIEISDDKEFIFCEEGKLALKEIGEIVEVKIIINSKSRKVTIKGLRKNRQQARVLIQQFVDQNEHQLMLYSRLKTPGLLKALLENYGKDMSKLLSTSNAKSVHVNFDKHVLEIKGDDRALKQADDLIKALEETFLIDNESEEEDNAQLQCSACFDTICVEDISYYKLSVCGHAYCKICLASIITQAMKKCRFPVCCVNTDCHEKLEAGDLKALIEDGKINQEDFVAVACYKFVKENRPQYEFCLNPNCDLIYKTDMNPRCPKCSMEICSTCTAPYHQGIDCLMYERAKRKQKEKVQ